jgi:hypothetical protein
MTLFCVLTIKSVGFKSYVMQANSDNVTELQRVLDHVNSLSVNAK